MLGYLPRFGPCFVNFYGSTREYSDLPDTYEDLNVGIVSSRKCISKQYVWSVKELRELRVKDLKRTKYLQFYKDKCKEIKTEKNFRLQWDLK